MTPFKTAWRPAWKPAWGRAWDIQGGSIEALASLYFLAVQAAGGSFDASAINGTYTSSYVRAAINKCLRTINSSPGLLAKIQDLQLTVGVNYAGMPVKVKAYPGSAASVVLTNFPSPNYVAAGASLGLGGSISGTVDIDVNASALTPTNFSHGFLRFSAASANNASNTTGNGAFGNLGIVRGNDSKNGIYTLAGAVANRLPSAALYLSHTTGVISIDGSATATKLYQRGRELGSVAAPSAAFTAGAIKIPSAHSGYSGAYWLGTSMTQAEHAVMASALQTLAATLGATGQAPSRRVLCIGDSLTYGFAPGFTQVSTTYFQALATAAGWTSSNSDLFMLGVSGQTAATILTNIANYTRLYDPAISRNLAIVFCGINDLMNSVVSAATLTATHQAIGTALKAAGMKVLWVTLPPDNTYAPATSLANYMSQVGTVNASLKGAAFSNGTYGDGVAIIDTLPNILDSTNLTYFQDGIHPTTSLYADIAGVINTAQAAIP